MRLQSDWHGRQHSVQRDTAWLCGHKPMRSPPHGVRVLCVIRTTDTQYYPIQEGGKKLHNENIKDMCFAPYSIREIKSRGCDGRNT